MTQRIGRLWWVLVLVPLLAAAVGWLVADGQESTYRASTTVRVSPAGETDTPAARTAATEQLVATLGGQNLAGEVAELHGLRAGEVRNNLEASRVGSSHLVEVSFEGTDADVVPLVLRDAVVSAQRSLHAPAVAAATQQQERSQAAADAATAALTAVREETGVAMPLEEYRTKSSEVIQLRVALTQADARLTRTGPIAEALTRAEQELTTLEQAVLRAEQPEADVERTQQDLLAAQATLAEAERGLAAAADPAAVEVGDAVAASSTNRQAQVAVSAAVIGLALAALIVALLLIARIDRGGKRRREPEAHGAATRPEALVDA